MLAWHRYLQVRPTNQDVGRVDDKLLLSLPFLIVRNFVVVTASWSVFTNLSLIVVNLLQEGEARERPPSVDIPYKSGQTERFTDVGVETKLNREESDVWERGLEARSSGTDRQVPCLHHRETSLSSQH